MAFNELDGLCPECRCDRKYIDHVRGEEICCNCGLVIADRMKINLPKRTFDFEDEKHRKQVGPSSDVALPSPNLTTSFWLSDVKKNRVTMHRIYKMQKKASHDKGKRTITKNLASATTILKDLSTKLSVPNNVTIDTMNFYKDLMTKNITRGRNKRMLIVTCLYVQSRVDKRKISMDDLARESGISKRKIQKCYRAIQRLDPSIKIPSTSPKQFINKICNNLGCQQSIETVASCLFDKIKDEPTLNGKHPRGISASLVLIASKMLGVECTQSEISVASKITTVTIRRRSAELAKIIDLESEKIKMKKDLNEYLASIDTNLEDTKKIRTQKKKTIERTVPRTEMLTFQRKRSFKKDDVTKEEKAQAFVDWNDVRCKHVFDASKHVYVALLRERLTGSRVSIGKELLKFFKDELPKVGISASTISRNAVYNLMTNCTKRFGYSSFGIPSYQFWKGKTLEEFDALIKNSYVS